LSFPLPEDSSSPNKSSNQLFALILSEFFAHPRGWARMTFSILSWFGLRDTLCCQTRITRSVRLVITIRGLAQGFRRSQAAVQVRSRIFDHLIALRPWSFRAIVPRRRDHCLAPCAGVCWRELYDRLIGLPSTFPCPVEKDGPRTRRCCRVTTPAAEECHGNRARPLRGSLRGLGLR